MFFEEPRAAGLLRGPRAERIAMIVIKGNRVKRQLSAIDAQKQ